MDVWVDGHVGDDHEYERSTMTRSRRYQKGVTLIELSLGLAITLAMTAVVAAMYLQAQRASALEKTRQEILQVSSAVTQMAVTGNRAGINAETVGSSGLIQNYMIRGAKVFHSLDGEIEIGEASFSSGLDARAMRIKVLSLKASHCSEIALSLADRFDEVIVNNIMIKDSTVTPAVSPLRSVSDSACTGGATVEFLFVQ